MFIKLWVSLEGLKVKRRYTGKGTDMYIKRMVLTGILANFVAGCSSPPGLPEPKGEWMDFESPRTIVSTTLPEPVSQPYGAGTGMYGSTATGDKGKIAYKVESALKQKDVISENQKPVINNIHNDSIDSERKKFVYRDGRNLFLYKALREIVPPDWKIELSPSVAQKFKRQVSWTGNDQWPYVLDKMLTNYELTAATDDKKKHIVIDYKAITPPVIKAISTGRDEQLPIIPSAPPLVTKQTISEPDKKVSTLPAKISDGKENQSSAKTETSSKSADKSGSVIPAKPAPVVMVWKLDKGTMLKEGVNQWALKEKCNSGNWTLLWETDVDYRVDAPLFFSGNFKEALNDLFILYQTANQPLYAITNTPQCLIRVTDK